MSKKTASAKKEDVWKDPLSIPAFLRVENRREAGGGAPGVLKVDDVPPYVPWDCRQQYRALDPEFRDYLTAHYRRGHFRWDWLKQPDTIASFARKREEKVAERAAKAAAPARRGGALAGLVPLAKLLEGLPKPVEPRHAKAALVQAEVPHIRWHVEPADVEHARAVISEYVPPAEPAGGGKWRGPPPPQHDPALVVQWQPARANPKRPGSGAHARWELVKQHSGRTVGQLLAAGGNPETLHNAVKGGYVVLQPAAAPSASEQKEVKTRSKSKKK